VSHAFIYDHVRTPRGRGKPDGGLHEVSTLGLATTVLRALKTRGDLDTHLVDDVVLGCVDPVGEAGGDIARAAALAADYGDRVPGVQINRFCASGLDAVNFAAAQIMAGQHELTVGGGVESMSRVGIGASGGAWPVDPAIAIKSYFMPQGISADLIATKYGFSRDDVDQYAVSSQQRAANAWSEGRFKNALAPVRDVNGITLLDRDEHMRPATDMQALAALKPSFTMMGEQGGFDAVAVDAHPELEKIVHVHHAGNSSGIVDGAAAVLIGSAKAGAAMARKPRGRIRRLAHNLVALRLDVPLDERFHRFRCFRRNKTEIDRGSRFGLNGVRCIGAHVTRLDAADIQSRKHQQFVQRFRVPFRRGDLEFAAQRRLNVRNSGERGTFQFRWCFHVIVKSGDQNFAVLVPHRV